MEEMKEEKSYLKRFFVFVSIFLIISLNSAFAGKMKAKIKNISLTGLFQDSDGVPCFKTGCMLPVDRKIHKIEFTYDNNIYLIPFLASYIKTTLEKDGQYYSDEVKVEYLSIALTPFYKNDAILKFKGYDENGNIMPIDEVINYRKADFASSGWMLEASIFPVNEAKFISKKFGKDKGATNSAFFILHFSYPALSKAEKVNNRQ